MELLETRFYSLTEIREITGKDRSRDIKRILALWGYGYEWKDRQGVTITKLPEAPLAQFTELMRRYLHIDTQINPKHFACFLTLLLEDEAFFPGHRGENYFLLEHQQYRPPHDPSAVRRTGSHSEHLHHSRGI